MELGTDAHGLRASRRNVVRGAAWSVPVVAVATAAPAFAASPCDVTSYVLDWNGGSSAVGTTTWSRTDFRSGRATITAPGGSAAGAIGVQFTSVWINDGNGHSRDRRDPDFNLTVSAETNVGGLNQGRGLYIRHESPIDAGRRRRQRITIAFDRPVTGLKFTITDIDATSDQYWDRVELVASGPAGSPTFTPTPASGIAGTGGVDADAWRQSRSNTTFNANQGGGNVGVSFANNVAVSFMTLDFWSATASGQQAIYLSDFRFSAKGC